MSDSGGDVIFFIHRPNLKLTRLANEFSVGQQIFDVISGCITAGPDSDGLF